MIRFLTVLVLLTVASLGCRREVKVTEAEARALAGKELADYCESHKLSPQNFRLSEITGPDGPAQWTVVYMSTGISPAREVAIGIMKDGAVERGVMIEGRDEGEGK